MGKNLTKADKYFSLYIRLRDTDKNGMGRCCSCGNPVFWKKADNGHYVNRKHMALRFSEVNCNIQCIPCNRFDEGNMAGYTRFLENKHGRDIIEKLMIAKRGINKIGEFELGVLADEYRRRVNGMKIGRNLTR